jgi:hypothetical protein
MMPKETPGDLFEHSINALFIDKYSGLLTELDARWRL